MKKAIIIGASSGIGKSLSEILVKNGYKIGISGRRADILKEIADQHPGIIYQYAYDCTKVKNAEKIDEMIKDLGGLDLFVVSAGTGELNPDLQAEPELETVTLNVQAFTEMAVTGFNYFKKHGKGHLVIISSVGGLRGNRASPSYSASKAYQINFMEGLRQKAYKEKLDINLTDIRPGFVNTRMAKGDKFLWMIEPKHAAKLIYTAIRKKQTVAYVPGKWRIIAFFLKFLPRSLVKRF